MFDNLEKANEEYEKLKNDYNKVTKEKDDLNTQFSNQKTIIEENKNNINSLQKEIDRLKIKNYEYFEQLSTQNNNNKNEMIYDDGEFSHLKMKQVDIN